MSLDKMRAGRAGGLKTKREGSFLLSLYFFDRDADMLVSC
jgi:hypothetical protein